MPDELATSPQVSFPASSRVLAVLPRAPAKPKGKRRISHKKRVPLDPSKRAKPALSGR